MMAFANGLRQEQHLCTGLQGTSLCPRFQSDTLTAENEIKPFLKPLPGQILSSSLEIIEGLCREKLNGPSMKMAEGPLLNGLITVGNRLTVFWGLIRLPNLLAVKQYIGCRLHFRGVNGCRLHFRGVNGCRLHFRGVNGERTLIVFPSLCSEMRPFPIAPTPLRLRA